MRQNKHSICILFALTLSLRRSLVPEGACEPNVLFTLKRWLTSLVESTVALTDSSHKPIECCALLRILKQYLILPRHNMLIGYIVSCTIASFAYLQLNIKMELETRDHDATGHFQHFRRQLPTLFASSTSHSCSLSLSLVQVQVPNKRIPLAYHETLFATKHYYQFSFPSLIPFSFIHL